MDRLSFLWVCATAWALWAIYWFAAAFFVNRTKSSEGLLLRMQHTLPQAIGAILILHGGHHHSTKSNAPPSAVSRSKIYCSRASP
jgi:hypothetical protein